TAVELSALSWKSLQTVPETEDAYAMTSPLASIEALVANEVDAVLDLLSWIQTNPSPLHREPEAYDRNKHFGQWIRPAEGDCKNTRAFVLIRDSETPVKFKDSKKCTVVSGKWYDPYTDAYYMRADDIQIDHFVPLKHAYLSGAYKWNKQRRCHYANFMKTELQLRSSFGDANNSKSDSSPDEWMPENKDYACQYLAEWFKVKAIWQLSMAKVELAEMRSYIEEHGCSSSDFKMSVRELQKLREASSDPINACK
ncbi:MAG: DUF1524 domain-containing protein, partial [Pseudobdellovibrionaceae bacterium]